MKTLLKTLLILVLALFNVVAFSQSSSPLLTDVQVKLMKMDGKFYIFLTDSKSEPFSNKSITVTGKSDGAQKISFSSFGVNAFLMNGNPGNFKKITLTFHLKDNKHNEYVYAKLLNTHQNENTYACPMHADEMFQAEGKCPKCGMTLVAKQVTVYDPTSVVRKGSK